MFQRYYGVFINVYNTTTPTTIYIGPAMGIVSSGLHSILLTTLRTRSYYLHLSEEEVETQYLMALNYIGFRTSSTF